MSRLPASGFRHRITRVHGEVQYGAVDLAGISERWPQAWSKIRRQLDMLTKGARQQGDHLRDAPVGNEILGLELTFARKRQ
jgi:hypothetical protein